MARRSKGEGCLLRRPGSNVWWAQWYVSGKAVRKTTGKRVKEEALAQLRKLMGDSERGIPLADGKLRYADLRAALIEDYTDKNNRTLETRADGTATFVGLPQLDTAAGFKDGEPGMKIAAITVDWIRQFKAKRAEEGAGPAMINRSLQALRHGLFLLRDSGKLGFVPKVKLMDEPKARTGFIEQEEFEPLLRALPTYLRPLIAFMYYTGVRKGEALSIEWSQVDVAGGAIFLDGTQTKNGEPRVVPLPSEVMAALREISPKHGKVFDGSNLRTEWETACAAAGQGTRVKIKGPAGYSWHKYSGLRLHDLRRSAVRNFIRAGASEKVTMDISGHKTAAVFKRYNITSTTDAIGAMKMVEVAAAKKMLQPKRKGKLSVQSERLAGRKALKPA